MFARLTLAASTHAARRGLRRHEWRISHFGLTTFASTYKAGCSCPLWAKSGHRGMQQNATYSITSLAIASTAGGIVRPSALAVFKLIDSSYLSGNPNVAAVCPTQFL